MTGAPTYMPHFIPILSPFMFWFGMAGFASLLIILLKDRFCGVPDRFAWVMICRAKFAKLLNANVVDQISYNEAYNKFTEIRLECCEAMKLARFQPDNLGKMELLGNIDPYTSGGHQIMNMCRKAIQVIEDAIKDEKTNNP